jgi:pimeloyl-ACP methyl ester carboxylesterase
LILAATSPGWLMIPGRPRALLAMLRSRRYRDPQYLRRVGPKIYGGVHRRNPASLDDYANAMEPPHGLGYAYQLLAGLGWTSLPWLWTLRQPTLVMHGRDDPIVPLQNARILAALIPNARLAVFENGHLFAVTRADEVARTVNEFLEIEAA